MKVRILSGLVAIALLVVVLILHKTFLFPLCIGLISAMAVMELFRADQCMKQYLSMGAAAVIAIATPILRFYGKYGVGNMIVIFGVMLMFLDFTMHHKNLKFESVAFMLMAAVLVPYSLNLLVSLNGMYCGLMYVILALSAAWISDTGAYFTGTFFGKRKLCPEISPKKTVEGFIGGIVADILIMVIVSVIYGFAADVHVNYGWLILTAAVCSVVGVLGDLSASVIKRQKGIKDYGNIMPGHGGVMDRFDSALFTVPVFYAFVSTISIYS